ncbi:MAG: hypothetical protein AAF399_10610 [Bacteroidota bacterium]
MFRSYLCPGVLWGTLFAFQTALCQPFATTDLPALYQQLEPEFLLMQAEYHEAELGAIMEQSGADWVYVFETFDLRTHIYHFSYRTYHEADRETYRTETGQWASELWSRRIAVDGMEGEEGQAYHEIAYDSAWSYAAFGTEHLAFSELFPRFHSAFELHPLSPAVTWYVDGILREEEIARQQQRPVYLNIPEIWVETLIDVKTCTTQRIVHLPVRTPARIVRIWGEQEAGR